MSSTTAAARELPRRSRTPSKEPPALRILEFAGTIPVVIFVTWSIASSWSQTQQLLPSLAAWVLVIAAADLMPVPVWRSVEITVSFPVLLASAMVFPPYVACFLGFVGPIDLREFRRDISLMRGLFNRANIAMSVLAASLVFHALTGDLAEWPAVLAVAFLALSADVMVNASLVTLGAHLLTDVPVPRVWHNISGGSAMAPFLLSYLAFGLLAVLLATVYVEAGNWALLAFAVPVLLARQMFVHWKRLAEASEQLSVKQRALAALTERIAEERRDERLHMAAGIHDEVLPPLYQVHLMGQILKQDLATGRLLELEDDLPELLKAVDAANEAMRGLIRELRASPLGSRGLAETIRLLTVHLQPLTPARFELELENVGGSPITQLIAYQVVREGLVNAARHSNAGRIRVFLGVIDGAIRLVVEDDGRGFAPESVDGDRHFGLQLMRERVELLGGAFHVDSGPDRGTTVVARLPIEAGT